MSWRWVALGFDLDIALVESHMIFNRVGGRFGIGVVPGFIFEGFALHFDGVVTGGSFPGAGGVGVAGLEILGFDGVGGKVKVALHQLALVTFSQDNSVIDGTGHRLDQVRDCSDFRAT